MNVLWSILKLIEFSLIFQQQISSFFLIVQLNVLQKIHSLFEKINSIFQFFVFRFRKIWFNDVWRFFENLKITFNIVFRFFSRILKKHNVDRDSWICFFFFINKKKLKIYEWITNTILYFYVIDRWFEIFENLNWNIFFIIDNEIDFDSISNVNIDRDRFKSKFYK